MEEIFHAVFSPGRGARPVVIAVAVLGSLSHVRYVWSPSFLGLIRWVAVKRPPRTIQRPPTTMYAMPRKLFLPPIIVLVDIKMDLLPSTW